MKIKLSTFTILILFSCLTVIGLSLIPLLSIQLKPSKTKTALNINYSWSNASAKVIEQKVTSKLEGVFNTIRGIRNIRSNSAKGRGSISLDFKKHSDMDAIRFEVASKIRQIYTELPKGVSYPSIGGNFGNAINNRGKVILNYSINAHESPYYIKKYAEEALTPTLTQIQGVNQVDVYGANAYEWVITYNNDKLLQLNIAANTISSAVNDYLKNQQLGIGVYVSEKNNEERNVPVSIVFNANRKIDWSSIPVKKIGSRIIYLDDVTKIRFKEAPVRSYHRINGLNSVSIVIQAEKDVNIIEVAKKVRMMMKDLKTKAAANGYAIKLTNDNTEFLSEEINKIKNRTFYSLLILLLLIIIINRNMKYVTILLLSIIANLSIAVIFYYLFKVELHLYALAGITISFGIIIDNSIIMIDHIRNKGDKKAFLAILAATMTTIGALTIIFFLKEAQRINLWDFALVIAINIGVSLFVSLFLVPALLEKFKIKTKRIKYSRKRKRRVVKFSKYYLKLILFCKRRPLKWGLILAFILGFGLPLHLLPDKIKGNGFWIETYNKTLGNKWFNNEVRSTLEKVIGGSLRLFSEETFANSYNQEPEKTVLTVTGDMPPGCTIEQLNEAIEAIENEISQYSQVKLYETNIYDPENSSIRIYFKDEFEFTGFPFQLKSILESKVNSLGAADWTVSGVGRGFSNALGTGYKSQRIVIEGYNYDNLYKYAEQFKQQLIDSSGGRIKEIEIQSDSWSSTDLGEYHLDFDLEKSADLGVSQSGVYQFLKNKVFSNQIATIVNDEELQNVKLVSNQNKKFNVWDLNNTPLFIGNKQFKLNQLATIDRRNTGNRISKINQKYSLVVAYDFIGNYQLAKSVRAKNVKSFREKLPIGYNLGKTSNTNWDKDGANQYYSLFIVILIIFFICSILLESLRQPLAIISMIPISFIGVFLTFYLFNFNFDQGGYASFILLCGISVNSALYIINDFNNLKRQHINRDVRRLYFKAYNYKIMPIILTIISTIVGLIPFLWNGRNEAFWFSFAVGSIGGLVFSLIGILLYLPIFSVKKVKSKK